MVPNDWILDFPGAVIVADADDRLIGMNAEAARLLEKHDGRALIGSNVLDCHPEPARETFRLLIRDRKTNVYTTEENGKKRLIYQSPWYRDGEYAGFVELSFDIPAVIPNIQRK
jgi:transcriptional regulator with PAS, ATPase and Fis domain